MKNSSEILKKRKHKLFKVVVVPIWRGVTKFRSLSKVFCDEINVPRLLYFLMNSESGHAVMFKKYVKRQE